MRTQIIRIAFTAALALATASTFSSCSSDSDDGYECGGKKYDTETQFCRNDVIINYEDLEECGDELYTPIFNFCNEGNIYGLCNGLVYDPKTQFCYYSENANDYALLLEKCARGHGNIDRYNPQTDFCVGGYLVAKCNGEEYDTYSHSQYCSNGNVVDKSEFTDNRDGKAYKYVTIGEQTWMAENLNYYVSVSRCYDDDPTNCTKYGRLYDWATAMGFDRNCNSTSCSEQVEEPHKGICPDGWHIPSDDEWDVLKSFVESDKDCTDWVATYLKSVGWGNYVEEAYGFAALPGGYGTSGGSFNDVGNYGSWWSTTEDDASYYDPYYWNMSIYSDDAHWDSRGIKEDLRSVRCVRD